MDTRRMRRSLFAAAAGAAFAVAAAGQTEWNSGTISYDGTGNIAAMGQDVYVYDSVGRLVSGTANQQQSGVTARQEYSYDAFGNRLNVTTIGTGCIGRCAPNVSVSTVTNRISGNNATYDSAGHMKSFGAEAYTYDGAEMVSRVTDSTIDFQYVYTADDERLATYTGQGNWRFTVRDVDKTVLREVTAYQGQSGTTWTWDRDHVYRDGLLLATNYPSGQRQQFHLDHLGSPRVVTDVNGARVGLHAYYPFGDELALSPAEWLPERLKFTGHERDTLGGNEPLDYMHARHYSTVAGRFLSLDEHVGRPENPQSLNRYTYVRNSPLKYIDSDGKDTYLVYGLPHFTSEGFPYFSPGHVALAINNRVFSYGTNWTKGPAYIHDWNRDFRNYLKAQEGVRDTTIFRLKITPAQEAELQKYLIERNPNAKGAPRYSVLDRHTCVSVCQDALMSVRVLRQGTAELNLPQELVLALLLQGAIESETSADDFQPNQPPLSPDFFEYWSADASLASLYNAGSFFVEGIEISFSQGGRFKP